ncbi:unnamed protein product [Arctogadus glacialis]
MSKLLLKPQTPTISPSRQRCSLVLRADWLRLNDAGCALLSARSEEESSEHIPVPRLTRPVTTRLPEGLAATQRSPLDSETRTDGYHAHCKRREREHPELSVHGSLVGPVLPGTREWPHAAGLCGGPERAVRRALSLKTQRPGWR